MVKKEDILRPIYILPTIIFLTVLWGVKSCGDWNTAILFGTALVIVWYTYETYLLRLENQKSTEFGQTPTLILRVDDSANPTIQIKNDSDVIAYDLEFTPFTVGKNSGMDVADFVNSFYIDNGNQYIEPRTTPALKIISLRKTDGDRRDIQFSQILHLMTIDEKKLVLLIHYKNSVGQKFYLVYKLYTLVLGLSQPALQFIETGKGEISFERACELTKQNEPQLNAQYRLLKYIGREIPPEE
jgi:hypothetical protein